jgi:dihydrolipoamide dehydrogenase
MAETSFDLIVVGGGPGGYVAAIRAAQLGLKTAVVEREHMGGICLNWGCIPTKALLRTSEVYGLIKHADAYGLSVKDVSFDPKKIVERSRKVASQLSNGVSMLMKKNKVTVFDGTAKLAGAGKLAVAMKDKSNRRSLTAKNIILATGARARQLPGLEPTASWSGATRKRWCRRSHAEVAAGHRLGRDRHRVRELLSHDGRRGDRSVEVLDRILPVEDAEISAFAKKRSRSRA